MSWRNSGPIGGPAVAPNHEIGPNMDSQKKLRSWIGRRFGQEVWNQMVLHCS